ncbi:MAG: DUF4255 domain-containing protein [Proteobacteria bacterium]|nr:DUF4255 domain-containing protein [Cystobacterineae bacterium]MCL2314761.1 DUF4255 domain-containing protein [Pseudomonadota bacterium]
MSENALSMLAQAIRSLLSEAINRPDSNYEVEIVIGSPHEAAKQQESSAPYSDYLCVFFYRVGYSGFPADATSSDSLYLSASCMITALGGSSTNEKTSGDSELKLMGAVAECFHRKPVLKLRNEGGIEPQIQIVPTQLTLDDINHLWATQNNTPYRLSLAYEFAVLPIPMKARVERAPRVGAVSLAIQSTELVEPTEGEPIEEKGSRFFSVQVPFVEVDIRRFDWAPHICLLEGGEPTYGLTLQGGEGVFQPQVSLVVLGDVGAGQELSLEWEVWKPTEKIWETDINGGRCQAQSALLPRDVGLLEGLSVLLTVPELDNKGQALLRVTRRVEREGGAPLILASNPILVTRKDEQ